MNNDTILTNLKPSPSFPSRHGKTAKLSSNYLPTMKLISRPFNPHYPTVSQKPTHDNQKDIVLDETKPIPSDSVCMCVISLAVVLPKV